MSNALLSDVEARAERRRTRTQDDMIQGLVRQAWEEAKHATDPSLARHWLDRAHRMMPKDGMIGCALATNDLAAGEWDRAARLFKVIAARDGIVDAWAGLATSAHLLGRADQARHALAEVLRRRVPDQTVAALARAIAPQGWCGLTTEGVLRCGPGRPSQVLVDGKPVQLRWSKAQACLPPNWRTAETVSVVFPTGEALGSPLDVEVFTSVEGFVETAEDGIRGWAWIPADPARDPDLVIEGPLGRVTLSAREAAEPTDTMRSLDRPRRFGMTRAELAALGTPLSLKGPNGRHLLGSPLDPEIEVRAASTPLHSDFAPVWADVVGGPPATDPRRRPVDVVIPVYRGLEETLACLGSVLPSLPRGSRVIVVNDASPDRDLVAALGTLASRRRITLIHLAENSGFPSAANAGIKAAAGRDVVLLNSDTLVPPGWLGRMRDAAYGAPDIGTVTPLTNDGTIVSYPDASGGNSMPDLATTVARDALAQRVNDGTTIDIPVGVGFCLYLRRDCLNQIGLLREDLFAQGYGEENDLCLRARHHGWRNVAAPAVYVAHKGATSFGSARSHLMRRNAALLERLHPGYDALIASYVRADPLRPVRFRLDARRWAAGRRRTGAVILITHGGGGGVDRVIADRVARVQAAGLRPILIQPCASGARVSEPGAEPSPNLVFALPDDLGTLVRLLRPDRPSRVELHHLLGHDSSIVALASRLEAPLVSVVHDYARFCPRIALVSTQRRYCGEPDVSGCEACIADLGSLLEDDPPVRTLLARSTDELKQAAEVVAPSQDAAIRIARHFPGIDPVVEPWEDDAILPPLKPGPGPVRRVVVVGAIGVEKGFEVLLGCVRDARDRGLALDFVVVGFTADDQRLLAAGPVRVTGRFEESEAIELIEAQAAQLAFIPSVWPETWCFALTRVWQAGLPAAVFDLGAQAERVRNTGRGWLLPLNLSCARINDALLRLAPGSLPGHSPPTFS